MVPEEVGNLFMVLTGEKWPQINEDQLRKLSESWRNTSNRLRSELTPELAQAIKLIRSEFYGKAAMRFADRMAPYVESNGYIETAATGYEQIAGFLKQLSVQTEYVKLVSLLSLIELLAEIAWAIAMAGPTFGASMAWLAGRYAIVRFLLKNIWGRLLMRVIQAQIFGIAFQVAIDAAAQGIQMAKGTRDDWDEDATKQAAAVGALGGALALPFAALGGAMGNMLAKGLVKGVGDKIDNDILKAAAEAAAKNFADDFPKAPSLAKFATQVSDHMNTHIARDIGAHTPGNYAGMTLKGMWAEKFGRGLADAVEEGLHEFFTEGLYGAMTGQGFQANPYSFTAGMSAGLSENLGSVIGAGIYGNLTPGSGENPFLAAQRENDGADSDTSPLRNGDGDLDTSGTDSDSASTSTGGVGTGGGLGGSNGAPNPSSLGQSGTQVPGQTTQQGEGTTVGSETQSDPDDPFSDGQSTDGSITESQTQVPQQPGSGSTGTPESPETVAVGSDGNPVSAENSQSQQQDSSGADLSPGLPPAGQQSNADGTAIPDASTSESGQTQNGSQNPSEVSAQSPVQVSEGNSSDTVVQEGDSTSPQTPSTTPAQSAPQSGTTQQDGTTTAQQSTTGTDSTATDTESQQVTQGETGTRPTPTPVVADADSSSQVDRSAQVQQDSDSTDSAQSHQDSQQSRTDYADIQEGRSGQQDVSTETTSTTGVEGRTQDNGQPLGSDQTPRADGTRDGAVNGQQPVTGTGQTGQTQSQTSTSTTNSTASTSTNAQQSQTQSQSGTQSSTTRGTTTNAGQSGTSSPSVVDVAATSTTALPEFSGTPSTETSEAAVTVDSSGQVVETSQDQDAAHIPADDQRSQDPARESESTQDGTTTQDTRGDQSTTQQDGTQQDTSAVANDDLFAALDEDPNLDLALTDPSQVTPAPVLPETARAADSFAADMAAHVDETPRPAELTRDGVISGHSRLLPTDGVWSPNGKAPLAANVASKIDVDPAVRTGLQQQFQQLVDTRGELGLLQILSSGRNFQVPTRDGTRSVFVRMDPDTVAPVVATDTEVHNTPSQSSKHEGASRSISSHAVSRKLRQNVVAGWVDSAIEVAATSLNLRLLPFLGWGESRSSAVSDKTGNTRERTAKLGSHHKAFDVGFQVQWESDGNRGNSRFDPTVRLAYPETVLEKPRPAPTPADATPTTTASNTPNTQNASNTRDDQRTGDQNNDTERATPAPLTPVPMPADVQQLIANLDSYAGVGELNRNVMSNLPDWVRQDPTLSEGVATKVDSSQFVEETSEGLVNGIDISQRTTYPKWLRMPGKNWSKHPEVKVKVEPQVRGFEKIGEPRQIRTGEILRNTKDTSSSQSIGSRAVGGFRVRGLFTSGEAKIDGHNSPLQIGPIGVLSLTSTRKESQTGRESGSNKDKSLENDGAQRYRIDLSLAAEITSRPGGKAESAPVPVQATDGATYVWVRNEDVPEFEKVLNDALNPGGTPTVAPTTTAPDAEQQERIHTVLDGEGMFKNVVRVGGTGQLRDQARQHIQQRLTALGVDTDSVDWNQVNRDLSGFGPYKVMTKFDDLTGDGKPLTVDVTAGGRKFSFQLTGDLGDVTGRRTLDNDVRFSATRKHGSGWNTGFKTSFGVGALLAAMARTTIRPSGYGSSNYVGGIAGLGGSWTRGKSSGHGDSLDSEQRIKYEGKADRVTRDVTWNLQATDTSARNPFSRKAPSTEVQVHGSADYRVASFLLDADAGWNPGDPAPASGHDLHDGNRVDMDGNTAVVSVVDLYGKANEAFHEMQRDAARGAKEGKFERFRRWIAHGGSTDPRHSNPKHLVDVDPQWWQTRLAGMFHGPQVRDGGAHAGLFFDRMQRGAFEMRVHNERPLGPVPGNSTWETTNKTSVSVSSGTSRGTEGEAGLNFWGAMADAGTGVSLSTGRGTEDSLGGSTKAASQVKTPMQLYTGDLVLSVRADAWQQLFGQPNHRWDAISPYPTGAQSDTVEIVVPDGLLYVKPQNPVTTHPDARLTDDLPLLRDLGAGLDRSVVVSGFTRDAPEATGQTRDGSTDRPDEDGGSRAEQDSQTTQDSQTSHDDQAPGGQDRLSDDAIRALWHAAPELFPGWTPDSGRPAPLFDATNALRALDNPADVREVLNGGWQRTMFRSRWFGSHYYTFTATAEQQPGAEIIDRGDVPTGGYAETQGVRGTGEDSSRSAAVSASLTAWPIIPTTPEGGSLAPMPAVGVSAESGAEQANQVGTFGQDRSDTDDHVGVRAPVKINFKVHKFRVPPLLLSTFTEGAVGSSAYRHPERREVTLPPQLSQSQGHVDLNLPEFLLNQPTDHAPGGTGRDITDAAKQSPSFQLAKGTRDPQLTQHAVDAIVEARGHKDLVQRWFGEGTPNRGKLDALFSPDVIVPNIGNDRRLLSDDGYTTSFKVHDRFLSVDYEVQVKPRLTDPQYMHSWTEAQHSSKQGAEAGQSSSDSRSRGADAGFGMMAIHNTNWSNAENAASRGVSDSETAATALEQSNTSRTRGQDWRRYSAIPHYDLVIRSKPHFAPSWSEHRMEGPNGFTGTPVEFDVREGQHTPFDTPPQTAPVTTPAPVTRDSNVTGVSRTPEQAQREIQAIEDQLAELNSQYDRLTNKIIRLGDAVQAMAEPHLDGGPRPDPRQVEIIHRAAIEVTEPDVQRLDQVGRQIAESELALHDLRRETSDLAPGVPPQETGTGIRPDESRTDSDGRHFDRSGNLLQQGQDGQWRKQKYFALPWLDDSTMVLGIRPETNPYTGRPHHMAGFPSLPGGNAQQHPTTDGDIVGGTLANQIGEDLHGAYRLSDHGEVVHSNPGTGNAKADAHFVPTGLERDGNPRPAAGNTQEVGRSVEIDVRDLGVTQRNSDREILAAVAYASGIEDFGSRHAEEFFADPSSAQVAEAVRDRLPAAPPDTASPDTSPTRQPVVEAPAAADEPVASFRVEAERWKALDDAFVFGSGDGRRRVQRGRGSGVRQQVSYSVIPEVGRWNLVTRLYLRPAEGVSQADLVAVRASTAEGIEMLVNQQSHTLPGPEVEARARVVFVDDPGAADGVVEVVAGR
ncbi:WXG100-like domain-containing protein, partial [Saccharopolyspora tripterygii]